MEQADFSKAVRAVIVEVFDDLALEGVYEIIAPLTVGIGESTPTSDAERLSKIAKQSRDLKDMLPKRWSFPCTEAWLDKVATCKHLAKDIRNTKPGARPIDNQAVLDAVNVLLAEAKIGRGPESIVARRNRAAIHRDITTLIRDSGPFWLAVEPEVRDWVLGWFERGPTAERVVSA